RSGAISMGERPPRLPRRPCGPPRNDKPLSALLAGIGWQVLFRGVFLGCRLDHRPYQLLVGVDPVGDEFPRLAVPLKDPGAAAAGVVLAGDLGRPQQTLEPQFRELVGWQVEVFEAPADLFSGQ